MCKQITSMPRCLFRPFTVIYAYLVYLSLFACYLRWLNTVFVGALADAIQPAHKNCKNKHAVAHAMAHAADRAIILFAQCLLYLSYFSLLLNTVC